MCLRASQETVCNLTLADIVQTVGDVSIILLWVAEVQGAVRVYLIAGLGAFCVSISIGASLGVKVINAIISRQHWSDGQQCHGKEGRSRRVAHFSYKSKGLERT